MNNTANKVQNPPVSDSGADRPINTREEDELGRSAFATSVARGIAARKGKESYVIGLYGSWGSGKSSVKNMILDALGKDEKFEASRPIIIEFNPWQCTDTQQLTQEFFRQIGDELGKNESHNGIARAEKWRQLGWYLSVGGDAVQKVATVAGFFGVPLMEFVKRIAGATEKSGEASKAAADYLVAQPSQSLQDLKSDLRGLMGELDRLVVIVLDDIDRLTAPEIALLLQLVKANGDFPNLVYLLLFQRDTVEASLNSIAPKESGADFLEKIIQLGLNLPVIKPAKLFDLLNVELARILRADYDIHCLKTPERFTLSEVMAEHGISSVLEDLLMPYFETVRDVRRFINALDFQAGLLKTKIFYRLTLPTCLAWKCCASSSRKCTAKFRRIKIYSPWTTGETTATGRRSVTV